MEFLEFSTIGEAFDNQALRHPEKTVLIYLGTSFSFGTIRHLSLSLARFLAQMGIERGDKVIMYLPNCPQWVIAWLGIVRLGASAVPITPIYTPHDLRYIANDSGAKGIICLDTNYGYVTEILQETPLRWIIYTSLVDLLPAWKRAIGMLLDKVPKGKVERNDYSIPFTKTLRTPTGPPVQTKVSGEEMAVLLYTGGTTKSPKGVPIGHRLFLESSLVQLQVAQPLIPWGENVIVQGAPLFHILGQVFGMGPICLAGGDTVILLPKVNLDGMMDAIQTHRAKSLFAVPSLYRMILEHPRLDFYNLSSLRYCFSGGDVLPNEIARRWKERFGVPIYLGYGATETVGGISLSRPERESPPQAMGLVLPNKHVQIVDPETLNKVPLGTPGEVLVSSEPMVTAYWNKPAETSDAFLELDGRLWYRTGDIVSMDQAGYLSFVDRTVDTIKHKGYRVSASEIEAVLQEHPAVVASCVVGVPDPKVGSRIKAYVILKEDIKGMTGYDLIRWCRERLVSYKIPQYIEFRDTLPKSKVGKLLRREVRAEEKKRIEKGKWEDVTAETG